jgi:8-oxo-dGTP pyrophosphatase MutT (NUDIX family)
MSGVPARPRNGKTRFPAGSILRNEEFADAAVSELFEETGQTVTVNDLTLLIGNLVRVPLPIRQYDFIHVFRRLFVF